MGYEFSADELKAILNAGVKNIVNNIDNREELKIEYDKKRFSKCSFSKVRVKSVMSFMEFYKLII